MSQIGDAARLCQLFNIMKLRKEFNRLSGLFGDGVEKVHCVTDHFGDRVQDETATMLRRARRGLRKQRGTFVSAEELIEQHLQDNAAYYVLAGLLLVGLFIYRAMSSAENAPHRDW